MFLVLLWLRLERKSFDLQPKGCDYRYRHIVIVIITKFRAKIFSLSEKVWRSIRLPIRVYNEYHNTWRQIAKKRLPKIEIQDQQFLEKRTIIYIPCRKEKKSGPTLLFFPNCIFVLLFHMCTQKTTKKEKNSRNNG